MTVLDEAGAPAAPPVSVAPDGTVLLPALPPGGYRARDGSVRALTRAVPDCEAVAAVLAKRHDFSTRVLADLPRGELLDEVDVELAEGSLAGGSLILMWTGHGVRGPDGSVRLVGHTRERDVEVATRDWFGIFAACRPDEPALIATAAGIVGYVDEAAAAAAVGARRAGQGRAAVSRLLRGLALGAMVEARLAAGTVDDDVVRDARTSVDLLDDDLGFALNRPARPLAELRLARVLYLTGHRDESRTVTRAAAPGFAALLIGEGGLDALHLAVGIAPRGRRAAGRTRSGPRGAHRPAARPTAGARSRRRRGDEPGRGAGGGRGRHRAAQHPASGPRRRSRSPSPWPGAEGPTRRWSASGRRPRRRRPWRRGRGWWATPSAATSPTRWRWRRCSPYCAQTGDQRSRPPLRSRSRTSRVCRRLTGSSTASGPCPTWTTVPDAPARNAVISPVATR